jgi:hypothetical protein
MNTKRRPGRYEEQPTERACKSCTVLKPIASFQERNTARNGGRPTYRYSCFDCESAKALARYYEQKALGKCSHCSRRPPIAGMTTCQFCRTSCRDAQRKSNDALRTEVLVRYGSVCANCRDPRIECLQIDHVGGWGKDHENKKGRRVSGLELMRWARDNYFPDSLRLLCGSCHSSLSYWGIFPRQLPTFDFGAKLDQAPISTA